jgi:hypothetical protein
MGSPEILANKNLLKSNVLSTTSEFDEFIDQPIKSNNNTGSLTLTSSGNYYGSSEIDIWVKIKKDGNVGTAEFIFSDDGGSNWYGVNNSPIFEDFEVITEGI